MHADPGAGAVTAETLSAIAARWNDAEQAAELLIDGRSLAEITDAAAWGGLSPFALRFQRRARAHALACHRDAGAGTHTDLAEGEVEVLVCSQCGDLGCGNISVLQSVESGLVIWSDPDWAGHLRGDDEDPDDDPELGPSPPELLPRRLAFLRADYERALDDVAHLLKAHGAPWRASRRARR